MKYIACHTTNYARGRTEPVRYLVIHYTANDGDTAEANGDYFARTAKRGASAHYFVDDKEVVQSVSETDTAWHCGAASYVHPECRNANSIGVELCSRLDSEGSYYFTAATTLRAAELTKTLMAKYQIPAERVIRHYDVTGKRCPAPFVDNPAAWRSFKQRLEVKRMTSGEAKQILMEKAGLSEATITFLSCYKYADELLCKLAAAMK